METIETINIIVTNKHQFDKYKADGEMIYIGRGSALGNPFTHLPIEKSKASFQVESREKAIQEYERWIWQKIGDKDESVIKELENIKSKAKAGKVYLVCYCKPKKCHGDIIKRIVEKSIEHNIGFYELSVEWTSFVKNEDE